MPAFKIPRRLAAFTHLNIRGENHGKEKVKAVDLAVKFTGGPELVDLLIPAPKDDDNATSEFFFTAPENGSRLRVPTINPVPINREPEGLMFTIYDKKDNPMVFREGSAKGFVVEFQEGGTVSVKCTLQGIPDDGYVERLKKVLFGNIEIMIESEQEDLFSLPPPPPEEPKDKNQGDLLKQALDNGDKGKVTDGTGKGGKERPAPKAKAKAKAPAKKKATKRGEGPTKH